MISPLRSGGLCVRGSTYSGMVVAMPQIHHTYLDPCAFFTGNERLDDIVLLVASYRTPHPLTRACINKLVSLGADVIDSWGCSDPALHRCIIAGRAWNAMRANPDRYKYVLWIDDDMVAPTAAVQLMREVVRQIQASVSCFYCKRGASGALALRKWEGDPLNVELVHREITAVSGVAFREGVKQVTTVPLQPVIGGMGCLMVPSEQFVRHVESVPNVSRLLPDGTSADMPGICSSGFCRDDGGKLGWLSEDLVYGQSLWHWCSGLYGLPIRWGHVSEVTLVPTEDAIWLNADDPTSTAT